MAAGSDSAIAVGPSLDGHDVHGVHTAYRDCRCQGLVDLQVNGFAGVDFNDSGDHGDMVSAASAAMRATGVTWFLATLISAPLDRFSACAKTLARSTERRWPASTWRAPTSRRKTARGGAHRREDISPPTLDDFRRRQEAAEGRIRLVTIRTRSGGRTAADRAAREGRRARRHRPHGRLARAVRDAVTAGATMSTHSGNGCAQMLPRHPNFLWEQLAADELLAGLIVDGHHLPAATVKSMVRAKTPRVPFWSPMRPPRRDARPAITCWEPRVHLDETGRVAVPASRTWPGLPSRWIAPSATPCDSPACRS
jgi:N-acetylglucosamine-6-phosphate deacetylase